MSTELRRLLCPHRPRRRCNVAQKAFPSMCCPTHTLDSSTTSRTVARERGEAGRHGGHRRAVPIPPQVQRGEGANNECRDTCLNARPHLRALRGHPSHGIGLNSDILDLQRRAPHIRVRKQSVRRNLATEPL